MATIYLSAFNTTFFPQYWFYTMTALVGFEQDGVELQVIFCLFQPVQGAYFFPSCTADGGTAISES